VAVVALLAREGRRSFEAWGLEAVRPDVALTSSGWAPATTPALVVRAPSAGAIQAVDIDGLTAFAREHGCLLVFRRSVGDFVPLGATILEVHGAAVPADADVRLAGKVALGAERTIEQDPAFALRVMVDIAIRALSPAINDPTTAVQVIDYLEEALRAIGATPPPEGATSPDQMASGVVMPIRTWADYVSLSVTEIRTCGATSLQVVRRLRTMLEELDELVHPANRPAIADELRRLDATVTASHGGTVDHDLAAAGDHQGLGGPAHPEIGHESRAHA
jgi:uncharacterized membrane protein